MAANNVLGQLEEYKDLDHDDFLWDGFTWGLIEAHGLMLLASNSENNRLQQTLIAEKKEHYENESIAITLPQKGSTATLLPRDKDKALVLPARLTDKRIKLFEGNIASGPYFCIGRIAALAVCGAHEKLLLNCLLELNIAFPGLGVNGSYLMEDLKRLPRYLTEDGERPVVNALKKMLQNLYNNKKSTILFLCASPQGQTKLDTKEEIKSLKQAISEHSAAGMYHVHDVQSCSRVEIVEAVRKTKPTIIHFSGHASAKGLVFEGKHGKVDIIPLQQLTDLMRLACDNGLRAVVLNACATSDQSDCIAQIVAYVVAMKGAVDDKAAVEFSCEFYKSVVGGHDISTAFKWGFLHSDMMARSDIDIKPLLTVSGKSTCAFERAPAGQSQIQKTHAWNVAGTFPEVPRGDESGDTDEMETSVVPARTPRPYSVSAPGSLTELPSVSNSSRNARQTQRITSGARKSDSPLPDTQSTTKSSSITTHGATIPTDPSKLPIRNRGIFPSDFELVISSMLRPTRAAFKPASAPTALRANVAGADRGPPARATLILQGRMPPCAFCSKMLDRRGFVTCKTCNQGTKFACADCVGYVGACLQNRHELYVHDP